VCLFCGSPVFVSFDIYGSLLLVIYRSLLIQRAQRSKVKGVCVSFVGHLCLSLLIYMGLFYF